MVGDVLKLGLVYRNGLMRQLSGNDSKELYKVCSASRDKKLKLSVGSLVGLAELENGG